MFHIQSVHFSDALLDLDPMMPTQPMQLAHVGQLAHRAVRLSRIETDLALEAYRLTDQFRQLGDVNSLPVPILM